MIKNVSHWVRLAAFLGILVLGSLSAHCYCLSGEHSDKFEVPNAAAITVPAQNGSDPFAEPLPATAPMTEANAFRLSGKHQDHETDLLYCGYRYYNASTGRWLNRDPVEEWGGANLYAFAGNDPPRRVDPLGLYAFDMEVKVYIEGTRVQFGPWTFNAGTKIDHVVHVDTDSEAATQTKRYIGATIKYDVNGNEVARATASNSGLRAYITCRPISARCGPCKECHIDMIGSASDPLFYGTAPPIDYSFFVSVTVCRGLIYFFYHGEHDRYPSYDYTLAGDNVHHWSHVAAGTSPLSLYSWFPVEFNGEIWVMTKL